MKNDCSNFQKFVRLFVGRTAMSALMGCGMLAGACLMYPQHEEFGQRSLAKKAEYTNKDFYQPLFNEEWKMKFKPEMLQYKMRTGRWSDAADVNMSQAVMCGALMRWNLRDRFPQLAANYLSGLAMAGERSGKEYIAMLQKVEHDYAELRQRHGNTGGDSPVSVTCTNSETLAITVTPQAIGPVIRLVVDIALAEKLSPDSATPALRWSPDGSWDLGQKHYRDLTWRYLPTVKQGFQRHEFVCDMSYEPEWLRPEAKPMLWMRHPQISLWQIVSVESLEAVPQEWR